MPRMPLYLTTASGPEISAWQLTAERTLIGRSSKSTIQLQDASVSREHAEVLRDGERYQLRDLGSRNGTRVNGVEAVQALPIVAGDRIEVGHLMLVVTSPEARRSVQLTDGSPLSTSIKVRADEILGRRTAEPAGGQSVVGLLAEAGQLLVLPRPMRETCESLLDLVVRAVPASRHVILLRDETSGELEQVAARVRAGRPDGPLAISSSILRVVLDECTSVVTADTASDPRFGQQHSIVAQAVRSALAVPLFDNQKVLGLVYVDSQEPGLLLGEPQLEVLTLLANMAAVKITNARLLDAEQARLRMAQELETATQIQRQLLPTPPHLPGWEIDACLESCYEVGGDLYDFSILPDGRLLFVLGDVTGKGMGAALLMSSFLASARVLYETLHDPGALSSRLSSFMHRSTDAGRFVTGIVGCLDPATGALDYVNAGHPSPCLVSRDTVIELESTGLPFGVLAEFPYTTQSVRIEPGGLLALFSDGIPEAQTPDGQMFDDERVHEVMRAVCGFESLPAARAEVLQRVDNFLGDAPRTDDLTLMLIRRAPSSG
ncbi:MAG: SpoIIE family protein phosphatase [Candidatus Eisenbacteria bacterium]|uniref:SpoIIE family protein phosphatase n=1 Tax=Eiseniibacteriota bacterium TaxID=2212470 RepID=A0A849SIT2_UNCEI|nr:SpoIIE family protein phosphatase [Candidatus Eisenbacteria bacterium]